MRENAGECGKRLETAKIVISSAKESVGISTQKSGQAGTHSYEPSDSLEPARVERCGMWGRAGMLEGGGLQVLGGAPEPESAGKLNAKVRAAGARGYNCLSRCQREWKECRAQNGLRC